MAVCVEEGAMSRIVYCTLNIRSNVRAALPAGLLRPRSGMKFTRVDNQSSAIRARRQRVSRKLGLDEAPIDRYHWSINTDGRVASEDIYDHVSWLFAPNASNRPLCEMLDEDFKYWLSVFWQGNGTGGGPLVTVPLADILLRHKMEMGICFYHFDSSKGPGAN